MTDKHWTVLDHDREIFDRELNDFVPDRIFDAHAHLYRKQFFLGDMPTLVETGPDADLGTFRYLIEQMTPRRKTSGLFFGYPHCAIDVEENNKFVAAETACDPLSRAQILIKPDMDPEYIRDTVRRQKFAG